MTLQYTIELDHSVWIPVPLAFPWNGYESDERWASDLSGSLLDGFPADADVREQLARAALSLARTDGPLPGALERFWHFPEFGGPERLVHLYVSEYPDPGVGDLSEVARAGVGGLVQVLDPIDGTPFARAARAVVITSTTDVGNVDGLVAEPIYVMRFLGFSEGLVFIIELIEQNSLALQELSEPLEALFRSIRLHRTP